MDLLFDMKTLLACNAALSLYVAVWLLLYKINQKTYPGFGFWITGAFFVALTYTLLLLSRGSLSWYVIVLLHGSISLAEVLRLDSISRLVGDRKVPGKCYWLPVLYLAVILYFTIIRESEVIRNVLLGIFSIVIIVLTSVKLFNNISKNNRNLYIATGLLYIMYGVLLFSRSFFWIINPRGGISSYGMIEQLYYFLILIFEFGLGISILTINGQRLELDLSASRDNLQETVLKLQAAIDDIKTLSGLLPICASCKKIRDDRGYWNQLEQYIQDRSEATFSHGICPECMKKLYPDEYAMLFGEK